MKKTAKSIRMGLPTARSIFREPLLLRAQYLTALQAVEYLILSTPTGEVRNLLTEANLKLMEAISKAKV